MVPFSPDSGVDMAEGEINYALAWQPVFKCKVSRDYVFGSHSLSALHDGIRIIDIASSPARLGENNINDYTE